MAETAKQQGAAQSVGSQGQPQGGTTVPQPQAQMPAPSQTPRQITDYASI
jgi:hypothetical protein